MKCQIIDIEQLPGESCGSRNSMPTGDTPRKAEQLITLLKAMYATGGGPSSRWTGQDLV